MSQLLRRFFQYLRASCHKKPYLTAAYLIVFGCHLLLMIYSQIHATPPLNPNRKKLIVKTMFLPPDPTKPTFVTQEKSLKVAAQAVATAAQKKQTSPAKTTKPVSKSTKVVAHATSKKPSAPSPLPSKTKKLLSELQESLANIETNRDNIFPAHVISVPNPISELKADTYEIQSDAVAEEGVVYRDMLIHHLKDSLHLPGYGTVKVELTLTYQGDVQNLKVMYSDSEVNRLYLENTLQELSFPSFIGELCNKKTYVFCLTFCSDQ